MKQKQKKRGIKKAFIEILMIVTSCGILLMFIFVMKPRKPHTFQRLSNISEYARAVEEYPDIDNKNWFNPDYSSYYESQVPSWWQQLLVRLRIHSEPEWSLSLFKDRLHTVLAQREQRKLTGACVRAVLPKDGNRYFLWTDLQGAFHSLVRCLEYLKEHGVINDNLELKENCYLIFNGNTLNYGPIILPAFTLVLQLMIINPNNVFYISSEYEQSGGWYDAKMAKQLHILSRNNITEPIPYAEEIDRFFDTLPNVLYLIQKDNNAYQGVEILFTPEVATKFTRECGHAFVLNENGQEKLLPYDKKGLLNNEEINIHAMVRKPESVRRLLAHPDGLVAAGIGSKEVFEWITFSSPNGRSHQIYQFFYDTIIEIATDGPIKEWTISEHRNDVRDKLGFEFGGTYYLATGLRPGDQERIERLMQEIEKTKKELELAQEKCTQAETLVDDEEESIEVASNELSSL